MEKEETQTEVEGFQERKNGKSFSDVHLGCLETQAPPPVPVEEEESCLSELELPERRCPMQVPGVNDHPILHESTAE